MKLSSLNPCLFGPPISSTYKIQEVWLIIHLIRLYIAA